MLFLVKLKNECIVWVNRQSIHNDQFNRFFSKNDGKNNNEFTCNTEKSKGKCDQKSKTKGVALSVFNCGIVTGYRELYESESCSQIIMFYLDMGNYLEIPYPKYLIYDDACHLKKFVEKNNIMVKSIRGKFLANITYAIDRLHFSNHNDQWCRNNFDPDRIKDLEGVYTVVCEETNYWLSGYKHNLKHINLQRYHFFLINILNMYNEVKI